MKRKALLKFAALWLMVVACIVVSLLTLLVSGGISGRRWVSADEADMLERYARLETVRDRLIKDYYREVDEDELLEGAVRGMMAALDDPYTFYYSPEEMSAHEEQSGGEYEGLGIAVQPDEQGRIQIIRIYKGSPAEQAGMCVGDCILVVNGEDVDARTEQALDEAIGEIRGEAGETLRLKVLREGEQIELTAVCGAVSASQVEHSMLPGDVGYIELFRFTGDDVEGFKAALAELQEQGARGLVIDLRNNPGGLLEDVVAIADELLGECTIVYTQDRAGSRKDYYSDAACCELPLAVLINGESASASEILAAAVQDLDRGTLVGTRSFGKGIVQTIVTFENDGAGMQYTSAEYFTPLGKNIHGVGITPDVIVESETVNRSGIADLEADVQLQAAVTAVRAEMG